MKKEQELLKIINDTLWMAIRYAHGRQTGTPSTIRDSVQKLKELYPDFKLKKDITIKPAEAGEIRFGFKGDWLDDLMEDS